MSKSNPIEELTLSMSAKEFRFIEKKTGVSFARMNAEDATTDFIIGIAAVKHRRETGETLEAGWDKYDDIPFSQVSTFLGLDDYEEEEEEVVEEYDPQAIAAAFGA